MDEFAYSTGFSDIRIGIISEILTFRKPVLSCPATEIAGPGSTSSPRGLRDVPRNFLSLIGPYVGAMTSSSMACSSWATSFMMAAILAPNILLINPVFIAATYTWPSVV